MKAFIVGFPKSGTTTLTQALEKSGLVCAHWKLRGRRYCGQMIYNSYFRGDDPLADFAGIDCITQADVCVPKLGLNYWPNLDFTIIRAIEKWHPECRFILNTRDPAEIVDSMTRWNNMRRRLVKMDIVGLPAGFGNKDEELIAWINGHYDMCRRYFGNDPKFLEFDIAAPDAKEKVGAFIGRDLSWWGVANKNRSPSKVAA